MTVAERPAAPPVEPSAFEREVDATRSWMAGERFAEIIRLYSPRNVVEQRGTIVTDYPVARIAADRLYARLRELFAAGAGRHHLRAVQPRAGGGDEAGRHRGDLPRRLGDIGQGIGDRGSRAAISRATR